VTIDSIDINAAIKDVENLLAQEKGTSPAMNAAIRVLLLVIKLMGNRLGLNSSNSSKPPSTDQKSVKKNAIEKEGDDTGKRKPGGQHGHIGTTLTPEDNPDKIDEIVIDKRTLPPGNYHEAGYESRQVVDIKISRVVTEYRAQI